MMRIAACLAVERGVEDCAPIHDAFLICAPLDDLDDHRHGRDLARRTQRLYGGVKSGALTDLSRLQVKPGRTEAITTTKPTGRKHVAGDFYMVPAEWTERAAAALKTSAQLRMALRLYRRWRMRRRNEAVIAASNAVLGGSRSRRTKYRYLTAYRQRAC